MIREPVQMLLDGPREVSTAGSPYTPARCREAILAFVCMVLHGRRVPGDVCGLDLASICHDACGLANGMSWMRPDKEFGDQEVGAPVGVPCSTKCRP